MRRALLTLVIVVATLSFPLNMERILSMYEKLVEDYKGERKDEFVSYTASELSNLSLYRFYKNKIVGSVEKREFALNIGDFLDAIYEVKKSEREDERIAQGLFLAYVSADLQGKNLTVSIIKKTNSFNKAFDAYGRKMRIEMYNLVKHVIAYHLGATNVKPPLDFDLPFKNLGYSYKIRPVRYDYIEDLKGYLKELKPQIEKIFDELSKGNYENVAAFRREFLRKSRTVMRFFDRKVAEEKELLARLTVERTPRKVNLLWIRFVIYAILVGIGLKFRRALRWIVTAIVVAEAVYIFTAFNPESLYEGLLYSLAIFFPFAFSVLLNLARFREKILWNILAAFLIISLFIPAYTRIEKLSMEEHTEFRKSPFYSLLKNDLYLSETSGFRLTLGKLTSVLSSSREETRDMVRNFANFVYKLKDKEGIKSVEVTPNGIYVEFPKMSDYYSYKNFDLRIGDFDKMKDLVGDYVAQEDTRKRKAFSYLEDLFKKTDRIVLYSAEYLREDFKGYVSDTFKRKIVLTPILDEMMTHFDVDGKAKSPSVYIFQTFVGLSSLMVLMMSFFAFNLGVKNIVMPILTLVSAIAPIVVRNLEIFVQYGIKPIEVGGRFVHVPLFTIASLSISILMFYEIFKRRVRV